MNRYITSMVSFIVLVTTHGFSQTLNFQVAGKPRSCVVHVPTGISNPATIFFLHGAGGSGAGFANDTKADAVADREKFIAAYPSGIGGNWDYADGSNDFTFIKALIDTIDKRYFIDRNRIYVTGFSMGGGMTFALGCKYADIFAAIAPVSAAGTACTPSRPIPVFLTFGTKDMYPTTNFITSLKRWAGIDSCPSTPVITRPYPATNAQSVVTRISYGPCAQGTEVIADSIRDGGHGWPTNAVTSVNQADEVWAFFKKFSLKSSTSLTRHTLASTHKPIAVSYSSGSIRITGTEDDIHMSILDIQGREIASTTHNHCVFINKPGGIYIVMVRAGSASVTYRFVLPYHHSAIATR